VCGCVWVGGAVAVGGEVGGRRGEGLRGGKGRGGSKIRPFVQTLQHSLNARTCTLGPNNTRSPMVTGAQSRITGGGGEWVEEDSSCVEGCWLGPCESSPTSHFQQPTGGAQQTAPSAPLTSVEVCVKVLPDLDVIA